MTVLVAYPAATGDSGQQSSTGTCSINNIAVSLSSGEVYAGCRFESITIASTATVSAATLSVYGASGKSTSLSSAIVHGIVPDQGVFTTTASDLSSLISGYGSAHTYTWSATLLTNGYKASGDISAIVSDMLAGAGWSSGGSMALVLAWGASSASYYSYAKGSGYYEELTITYTAGGGTTNITAALTPSASVAATNAESVAITGNLT